MCDTDSKDCTTFSKVPNVDRQKNRQSSIHRECHRKENTIIQMILLSYFMKVLF